MNKQVDDPSTPTRPEGVSSPPPSPPDPATQPQTPDPQSSLDPQGLAEPQSIHASWDVGAKSKSPPNDAPEKD